MKNIKIGNKFLGAGKPVLIIAEMAQSHEGSLEVAKKMVKVAADAEADIIQFQILSRDDYIVPNHPSYELVGKLEMKPDEWAELFEYTRQFDILISAAAYDIPSADLIAKMGADAYKIHSADLSNPQLLKHVARMGKPVFLGVGASTLGEIETAITTLKSEGNNDIILMHGYQNFPTELNEMNLRFIRSLCSMFQVPVGFFDHTAGGSDFSFIVPLVSIPFGACVIEKHFTLDRSLKGIDHESALNPDEFKKFVEYTRKIEETFGSYEPHIFTDDEEKYRKAAKKSIIAGRDIKTGELITEDMLLFMRSTPGVPPTEYPKVVGRTVKRDINKYNNITWDDLY